MKNIMKLLVLSVVVLGFGSQAFAQPAPCNANGGGGTSGLDCFTLSNTIETGLMGDLMAVTPDGEALADASVVYNSSGLYDAALAMIPFTGGNGGGFNPANGLTTNFNQTGVANAFGYGSGPFMFPAGSPGTCAQGVGPTCPPGILPPGGGTSASTPTNEFQSIDQIVGKYTASGGFAQNFFTAIQRPALATNNNMSTGLSTLEQGDTDMGGGSSPGGNQAFKSQVAFANGVALDPDVVQLVQQDIEGVGPFSSCMNCFPGNVVGVSGDTPLGLYPNGQQGGIGVLYNSTVTLSNPGFTQDVVSHPGP
jgi:hypothetical protein